MNPVATFTDEVTLSRPQWRRTLRVESDPSSIPVREIEPRTFPAKSTAYLNWTGVGSLPKTSLASELENPAPASIDRVASALTVLVFVAGMHAMLREYPGTAPSWGWDPNWGLDRTLTGSIGAREELNAIASQLKSGSRLGYREQLAGRIVELLEDWEEVPAESAASLRSLLKFLEEHPKWKRPLLYATDNGMFGAEWLDGAKGFSVYASTTGRARFSLIDANGRFGGTVAWHKLETLLPTDGWLDA